MLLLELLQLECIRVCTLCETLHQKNRCCRVASFDTNVLHARRIWNI